MIDFSGLLIVFLLSICILVNRKVIKPTSHWKECFLQRLSLKKKIKLHTESTFLFLCKFKPVEMYPWSKTYHTDVFSLFCFCSFFKFVLKESDQSQIVKIKIKSWSPLKVQILWFDNSF